jgi:glycosyltransferase involved in cell wall biosynthesis
MRITILNWRDRAHPESGGAENFVHEVGRRWAVAGHEVTLVSSRFHGSASHEEMEGISVVRDGHLKTGTHHYLAPKVALRRSVPDVVLESINTVPYQLPFRRHFPPFVSFVHQLAVDVWDSHLPGPLSAAARSMERWMFHPYRGASVLTISESTAKDLREVGVMNTSMIPQGGIGPQSLVDKASVPTLLFVGRLTANKRPDHAIEAFRSVKTRWPEARLWVVGEGKLSRQLVDQSPRGVEFLGRLGRSELLERMGRAHALLVTSVREGWGLVVTEAGALGTPTVAYDVPGLRDAVRDGVTGLLTTARPTGLADAVHRLLEDPSNYERVRREAIAWGSAHTWDRTAESLLAHLHHARRSDRALPAA